MAVTQTLPSSCLTLQFSCLGLAVTQNLPSVYLELGVTQILPSGYLNLPSYRPCYSAI